MDKHLRNIIFGHVSNVHITLFDGIIVSFIFFEFGLGGC